MLLTKEIRFLFVCHVWREKKSVAYGWNDSRCFFCYLNIVYGIRFLLCVLWWCHSHPGLLSPLRTTMATSSTIWSEVGAAVFCLKFVWPWKMDSSVWCYQVCNENGGASFSTQLRHCFTMRQLIFELGAASSWNFLWRFFCFLWAIMPCCNYSRKLQWSPLKMIRNPKREAVFPQKMLRVRSLIMFDPSLQTHTIHVWYIYLQLYTLKINQM